MDFHNLKRRELQELCKKHKIPANLTNLEMATKLTALLMGNEKPLTQGRRSCLKGLEDNGSENESDVEKRPAKKVRFSPQNEMIEFEKSEVKVLERRDRWRRKSVLNKSKGNGAVENGSLVAVVDEGIGRVTRSRRGKVIEGSEVESMGGGKRGMKDDALKDKLLSASGVVGTSSDAVMDEGAGRRVTRSTKVKLIDGTEVESKGGRRGKKGDDLKGKLTSAVADNVPLVNATNEELVEVGKRSLRNRVVGVDKKENNVVEKGSRQNEEHVVERKRSLRNIEPKDEEETENEDAEKGSKKNGSHRTDRGRKDIAGTKATEEEPVGIQPEKVLRRSRRHVAEVDYHNLVNEDVRKNEKVGKGRSRSMVAVKVKEGFGVDHISGVVVKEGSPADNNLRRSKRNAVKPEGLVTMEQIDDVANANDKKETKKRRRDAVVQEQAVKVDGNSVEMPFRRSTRNTERSERVAPTIVRGKVAQKEKGRSKKSKGKVEDSLTEEILTSEDLPAPEAELTMPEVAKDTVMDNFNDTAIDLAGCLSDIESADASESNFVREDQDSKPVSDTFVKNADSPFTDNGVQKKAPGTNGKSVHLSLDDNDVQKQGGKAYIDGVKKWGNDSEQALYLRKTPLTVKNNILERQRVCSDVIDELNDVGGIAGRIISETYSVSVRELTKEQHVHGIIADSRQLSLEESNCRDHGNPIPPNAVCEVATTDTVDGCTLDAAVTSLNNVDDNEKEELTGTLHSMETLKQRKESMPIQRNSCEAQNLSAADTNFNHHALTFSVDAKFEDDGHSKIECEISDDCCQPNASDAFRISATRKQQDGNVGSGVDINQPVDLQGKDFVATPMSAKAVENVSEFGESGFDSRMADPSICNFTLELQDDHNCKVAEESLDTMGLETHSELRAQSPSEQGKGVEAEFCEDGHNPVESSNHEDVGHLEHQDDALDYSGQKDHGVTKGEDSVAISDAQGVVLLLHSSESTQISEGAKCTEIELSKSKSSSMSTIPANSSSMLKYQGYGAGSEVEKKEENAPMQELYMMKMPSTIEDDGLERCNMSTDGGSNGVIDVLNDQQGPMEEGTEYRRNFKSGCEAAIGQHEIYIGEEGNLVKSNCNALENHLNLIAVSEAAAATAIVDDCLPVAVHTPLKNTAENHRGENTSITNSRKTLKQTEESTPVQRNVCEAHNPSASETTLDHHELNTSAKCQEPVPDASRKMLHDGNVNGCDIFVQPSSLQGMVFTSAQISSTTVETGTEFSENFSHVNRVASPKSYFNFEFLDFREDSSFTYERKSSPLPDNNLQKQGTSTDNVGSDEQSEVRTQSPSKQRTAVDGDFVVEAYTALEDVQNHVEANFEEVEHLRDQDTAGDDCLQHTEKFSENFSHVNRVESPQSNFNFEFLDFREDSSFTYESKSSPLPDNNLQKQGASTDNVGSDEQSELRTQSPSKQRTAVDGDFVVEAYTALKDVQNHVEAKFEEVEHLRDQDRLQHTELDSSTRSKYGFIQDQGVSNAEDTVETADLHLVAEAYITLEDWQNNVEVAKFEEDGHLKDQDTALDDSPQYAELECSARCNFIFIRDQGVSTAEDVVEIADSHLSPPSVATHIIEGRQREIEHGTRKCNSMSKTPTNLKDQDTALDDSLQYAELECPARSKFIFIQDQGVSTAEDAVEIADSHLSPPSVATHIIEGRQREIELSTRKCNSMSKTPTNSNFISELTDTNTEIAPCHLTDEHVQNKGYGACSEGERDKENDPVQALDMIQMPSTSKIDGLEGSIMSVAGSLCGAIDVLNIELGSMTQAMESNGERVCDSETNIGKEMKKSCTREEGEKLEILLTEPVSVSSTRQEKNTSSHENEMEIDIMSLKKINSPGREGRSCQSDEEVSRQEQGQDTSSHKDSVDAATAVEHEIKGTTQRKIFPNAAEGSTDGWNSTDSWHGDELQMLFRNSVTGPEDNIHQERDEGAFSISNFRVASAEYRDHIVLSNGSSAQHDEQKIGDSGIQKEIKVGEDNQNDEHADSGAEIHMLRSLEMNISLEESKEDDSFPLYQNKDVGEEAGTSIAMFVSEQVIMPEIDAKDKVGELDLKDPVASESSISKSQELSRENDVDTMIDYVDSGSVKVAETPLIEPEAESVEETVDATSKNERPPTEEEEEVKARVNNQCLENAGGVFEDTSAMHSKTISSLSKNLDAVEGESMKSPTKQFTSTVKRKNARTILIHGTPNKLQMTVDMKENAPNSKLENVGTCTTVRPAAKRPALKDLPHK